MRGLHNWEECGIGSGRHLEGAGRPGAVGGLPGGGELVGQQWEARGWCGAAKGQGLGAGGTAEADPTPSKPYEGVNPFDVTMTE